LTCAQCALYVSVVKSGPKQSERTQKALALYAAGKSAVVAAYMAGVNPSTLYRALQKKKLVGAA